MIEKNGFKCRKKPVVVTALEYTGPNYECVHYFTGGESKINHKGEMIIKTLEGEHIASVGDFIIRGVKGEYYPCKPDIFWMTYEAEI